MPRVRVEFHSWLADAFGPGGQHSLELDVAAGATVRQALTALARQYPAIDQYVISAGAGELQGHAYLVLNDRLLDAAGGLAAELKEGDRLAAVPAYFGG